MFLFTALLITLVIVGVIAVVAAGTVGAATLLVFGDVIVCVLIVFWLIKLLFKKR